MNVTRTLEAVVPPNTVRSGSPYSPAIRAGGFVFASGHVPTDPATGNTVGQDIATQTRQVIANLMRTLEAGGASLDRVVKTTVFLTRIQDFQGMNAVYREYFAEPQPARSTVEVSALGKPDYLVEIEATALLAEDA